MLTFPTKIAGIPCQIQVDHYFVQKPLGPTADSDWDCYGYTDLDFTVLDRKGYPAPWLERKLTAEDRQEIEQLTEKELENERNNDY